LAGCNLNMILVNKHMKYKPLVSIIIPALNEEKYISKLLGSLAKQTYKNFEIIVADAGSTDKTVEIARHFGALIVKGGMPARGRNNGAKAGKGDYFIFLDADVIVDSNFIEKAIKEFDKNFYDMATFILEPITSLRLDELLFKLSTSLILASQRIYPHAPGSGIMCTKRIFYKINGFNEKLYLCEDHDFVNRGIKWGSFGVLKNLKIKISVRRLEKEGRVNLFKKYLLVELYRVFKGEIDKNIFEYEFGKFDHKDLTKMEKFLEKILKKIEKI